jgi:hypothetical protein
MAQPSPIHWWKSIVPCVVSIVKLGASELMRKDIDRSSRFRISYRKYDVGPRKRLQPMGRNRDPLAARLWYRIAAVHGLGRAESIR